MRVPHYGKEDWRGRSWDFELEEDRIEYARLTYDPWFDEYKAANKANNTRDKEFIHNSDRNLRLILDGSSS